MSIQSNMVDYELLVLTITENSLGERIEAYNKVVDIGVSINYVNMSRIDNGIVYNVAQPQGITEYKEFDINKKYRLSSPTFEIESINQGGRYTQLILKELII